MRKLFTTLVLLLLMAVPSSAQNIFFPGDVNGDGDVDISDVVGLVNLILNGGGQLNCPDNHHPHLIDLGLPSGTKWSCCNVGATAPEGYGGYYAWGETVEKTYYDYYSYIHCNHDSWGIFNDIGNDICGTEYDVATMKWSKNWQLPSTEQFKELEENCTSERTVVNGIYGLKFKGKNGGSIFLPFAGYIGNELSKCGSEGHYWSGTQQVNIWDGFAEKYFIDNSTTMYGNDDSRYHGRSVRPVVK